MDTKTMMRIIQLEWYLTYLNVICAMNERAGALFGRGRFFECDQSKRNIMQDELNKLKDSFINRQNGK